MSEGAENLDRRRHFIEGAIVPAILTALTFVAGFWISFREEPAVDVGQALKQAWDFVETLLVVSFALTGTSIYVFLFDLQREKGRWRLFGASSILGAVAIIALLT